MVDKLHLLLPGYEGTEDPQNERFVLKCCTAQNNLLSGSSYEINICSFFRNTIFLPIVPVNHPV